MGRNQLKGKVILTGAGPGDPGLLTIRAREAIQSADVLIYDYLANPEFLDYRREGAEIYYVGKKGDDHTLPQEGINDRILREARAGKLVVRLKGGDPFIFGRGGEEAEELVKNGIDYEVIPGVTAGGAATAYAGIPLTHRSFTSTVAFITGHEDPTKTGSRIAWDKIATGIGTLVFYMGIKNLPHITSSLVKHGRSPETPAAVIRWGTTPRQETVVGTLATLVDLVEARGIRPPAITVVGEVISLKGKLDWFERRPLFGKNIVVTRAREQASEFAEMLDKKGAHVLQFPSIEIVPPSSWEPLDRAIRELESYHWVIFTSINGVSYFLERLRHQGRDIRDLKGIKICAIGPRTAEGIEKLGVRVDFVPSEYRAEAIIEGLKEKDLTGKRLLLPRAREAREILPEKLSALGAVVDVVEAYQAVRPDGKREEIRAMLKEGTIHMVTFASSSTVRNFLEMFESGEGARLLRKIPVACIGPITEGTAREKGLTPAVVPKEYTLGAMTEAITEYFTVER